MNMRKSVWLLSAGLVALATPALGQSTSQSTTDTDKGTAQPTQSATEGAAVQDQAREQQPVDTSDIVITATRRNEALSDVPMAVSAVTAESLENTGATDIRQLNQLSPSLLVSSTSSEAGAAVARIRGVGTVGDNPGLEGSVGVFIDGVYRSRTGSALTELGPVDRIEVLRGPQGTLFGRNTSAGLIHVITAKPRFEPEVYGQVDIGNYDLRRFEAGVTGGLTSSLAARLDGVYTRRDGFLKDVISGRDLNDRNRWLLRGQLLYQPTDDLSVRFIADYTRRREECCGAVYLPMQDFTAAGSLPSTVREILEGLHSAVNGLPGTTNDDPGDRETSITPGRNFTSNVNDWGLSNEVVYDFGGAELTSISAYRYNKYTRGQDPDFNNLDIWFRDDDGGSFNRFKTFTQELRLQGQAFGGKLDWLVGGYYANEKLRVRDNITYGSDYTQYVNCVAAYKIGYGLFNAGLQGQAPGVPNGSLLGSPGAPGCMNTTVAGQIATSALVPASVRNAVGLLAGLNPATPGFNGFDALARVLQLQLSLPTRPSLNGSGLDDEYNQTSNNFAIFTHNIFSITDNLKFTAGLRYTHEKKKLSADLTDTNEFCRALQTAAGIPPLASLAALQTLPCVIPSVPGGSFSDDASASENKLSGTAVLSYKPTDRLLTYISYSRGYKAGGFNLDRTALPRLIVFSTDPTDPFAGGVLPTARIRDLHFKPEVNNAFELGAKYNGPGIDVNFAVFNQLFKNFQLNAFNGVNFEVVNINSCKDDLEGLDQDAFSNTGACPGGTRSGVRSRGAELEIFARPLRDLSINLGATYVDTKYRKNLVGANGVPLSPNFFQLPGRRISNSSQFTATGSVAWTPRIGGSGLRGLIYADMRHVSSLNTGSDLDIEKIQPRFNVVNARVGLRGPDDMWGVELWAQNLFDKTYTQVAIDGPIQGYGTGAFSNTMRGVLEGKYPRANQLFGAFLGEPRTFGVTLRGKLGFRREAPPVYTPPPAPPPPPVVEQPAPPPPAPPPPPPPPSGERG
jgi:outer membrane receptor protein involved in Fe transport